MVRVGLVVLVVAVYDLLRFGDELEVYAAGVGGWPCHDRIAGAWAESSGIEAFTERVC